MPLESARNDYTYYKHLQAHDQSLAWGIQLPNAPIPGLVIESCDTGLPFTNEELREVIRCLNEPRK